MANFTYENFDYNTRIFTKTLEKKHKVFVFGLNDDKMTIIGFSPDSNNFSLVTEDFGEKTRDLRSLFFTDTSIVALIRNKKKGQNTVRFEYSWETEQSYKTTVNLNAFDDNNILAHNVIDGNMMFVERDKDQNKLVVKRILTNLQTRVSSFDINNLVQLTGLKKGKFEDFFLSEKTPIDYTGNENLFTLSNFKRYFFKGDTLYIIAGNLPDKNTGLLLLDLNNNLASYTTIIQSKAPCKKKCTNYGGFSCINNVVAFSFACEHNLSICLHDAVTGNKLKEYDVDSTSKSKLNYSVSHELNFNKGRVKEITNVRKGILQNLGYRPFFVGAYKVDAGNFMLVAGNYTYRKTGLSVGQMFASLALSAVSIYALHSAGLYLHSPTSNLYIYPNYSRLFFSNENQIARVGIIATNFSNTTYEETPGVSKSFLESEIEEKPASEDELTDKFIYNKKTYQLVYDLKSKTLTIAEKIKK